MALTSDTGLIKSLAPPCNFAAAFIYRGHQHSKTDSAILLWHHNLFIPCLFYIGLGSEALHSLSDVPVPTLITPFAFPLLRRDAFLQHSRGMCCLRRYSD